MSINPKGVITRLPMATVEGGSGLKAAQGPSATGPCGLSC